MLTLSRCFLSDTKTGVETIMTTPENLYEAASYALNQFRERRMAERRATQRDTPDRRVTSDTQQYRREGVAEEPKQPGDPL